MNLAKKLTYKKINNSDDVLMIDLHNGYSVIAVSGWEPKSSRFITTLYLKDNEINHIELIEDAELLEFCTDHKTIGSAILKKVSELLESGFFEYYIKRYNFYMLCIDKFFEVYDEWKKF